MKLLLSLSLLLISGFAFAGDIDNQIHQANLKAQADFAASNVKTNIKALKDCDCCKCEPCLCNALKSTILLTAPQKLKATDGGPDWTFDGKNWCRQVTEYLYTDGKGYTSDPCPGGVCLNGTCANGTCGTTFMGSMNSSSCSSGSCGSGGCSSGNCSSGGGRRRR